MTLNRVPKIPVTAFFVGLVLAASALSAQAAVDLSVSNAGPASVKPGEQVTYLIQVYNGGLDPAPDTMLFDPNPIGLVFLPPLTGDCAGTFPCALGTLPAGQSRTVSAKFLVPASYTGPDLIENTASATTSSPESDLGNNQSLATTAVVRIAGFHTLPPCRIVDTRNAVGPLGGPALPAGQARTFDVRAICGVPGNASSVSVNLTVTGSTGNGDLRLFAGGTSTPASSSINYAAGQTRANNGIVPLSGTGTLAVKSNQDGGATHLILDVNGYFTATDQVPTPASLNGAVVKVRPAPEVELTFDNVTVSGVTTATVIEFPDNRMGNIEQNLQDFFAADSPYRLLLPRAVIPRFVKPLGKGGPTGVPTFVLSIVDTTAQFSRTAEFHGLEDFRLGWHPPCVVPADPTQEPRTFYAREEPKNEPSLVEDSEFESPVFVDISSGCGSNKGSGWNFSLYLTARDTRTPLEIAQFMLLRIQDAVSTLGTFIDPGVASQLQSQASAAYETLVGVPASSLANINNFLAIVDDPANAMLFGDGSVRNVRGEMAGRAQAIRYMITKLLPTGTITEFPLPVTGAWPFGIAAGPDGNVWFAEVSGVKIGKITPAGAITEFNVPTANSQPVGIVTGSDGNLWFTEHTGQKVGRITPAGAVTEFPDPTFSYPYGIAAGPDGNLWFTGRLGAKIGKVTTAGVVTTFPIPGVNRNPSWIAAGSDGNLWFTEIDASRIGRITPAGAITEFVIPTASSGPQGIAAGPDGNLWFTEVLGNRIGRITPAGVITEFPIPTANSQPWMIAAGPDGNLWFTEQAGNQIGRITPAGAITEFPIPTANSQPYNIVAGPDGNLWFGENAGKIGRISP